MMPRLDGFGLLGALRADPRTRTIPVILLSARAGEESRVEGLEAGADDYLVKPFSARELLARVGAHLEMNRLRQEASRRERALLEETRAAKERLETVLRSISDGFIALDRDWRYTTVNDRACESMGMSRDEILGRRIWDLYPDTVGTPFEAELRRAVVEQKPSVFEYLYPSRNRWYENRLYPSADGLSIFFTEVTERKRAEEALRESEGRFRNMADNAPVGVWVTDPAGRCTYVNEWWCRFTGTTPEQSLGFGWLESVHPDDRRQAEATFRAANDRRGTFRVEYRRAAARRGVPPGDRLGGAAAGAVRESTSATSVPSSTSPRRSAGRRRCGGARRCWPRPSRSPTSAVGAGTSRATRSPGRTSITASWACGRRRPR